MAAWTPTQYTARLKHETNAATTEKGIARLKATCRDVERFLESTQTDADVDGWIALLRGYESAAAVAGLKTG